MHAHVYPFDYYTERPCDKFGLARAAGLIATLRAEVANCLVFDNGDFLQGSPLGDVAAALPEQIPAALHPVIAAMNAVGYDAATIGNHDFNYGVGFLLRALAGADFPIVSCNVVSIGAGGAEPGAPLLPPVVILDRLIVDPEGHQVPIRIGVVGMLPPQVMQWDHENLVDAVVVGDMVPSAEHWVPRLREAGADLVIALAHTGIDPEPLQGGMENACLALAQVPGIDMILAGHSHQLFPAPDFPALPGVDPIAGTLHGVPTVLPGFWGSHVGAIDLWLCHAAGKWRIAAADSCLHPVLQPSADLVLRPSADPVARPLAESAPDVLAAAATGHAATLREMRRPVGHIAAPLQSYFALIAAAAPVQLVAEAQRAEVERALRGTDYAHLPVLSAASPGKAGGLAGPDHYIDIEAGEILLRHVADIYPFPNSLRAIRVTGADVQDWLERSAGLFRRIVPGRRDQMLLDPGFPSYDFDLILGVTYRIDLSQPARFDLHGVRVEPTANRIVDLRFAGHLIAPAAEFILATNDYRAYGGGGFPACDGGRIVGIPAMLSRDVLARHISRGDGLVRSAERIWGFVPMPGTSALFDSGPGALKFTSQPDGLRMQPVTLMPDGFQRFRIEL